MTKANNNPCPITGKPLPAGYVLHPCLAGRVRKLATRVAMVMPEARRTQLGLSHHPHAGGGHPQFGHDWLIKISVYDDIDDMRDTLYTWGKDLITMFLPGASAWSLYDTRAQDVDWHRWALITQTKADAILHWQHAPAFLDECEHAVNRAERLTQPNRDKQLLLCPQCYQVDYYPPGRVFVTCPTCHATYRATDSREQMLSSAYARPLTRRQLHTLLNAAGYPVKRSTLDKWVTRRQLTPIGDSPQRFNPRQALQLARKQARPTPRK